MKDTGYRPISALPYVSIVEETIQHKQITFYMNDLPSNYITGFLKLHGSQHYLLKVLENWKRALCKGHSISAHILISKKLLIP